MADTLENIKITAETWIDFYSVSGIARGETVSIQNIGVSDLYYTTLGTQPDKDYNAYQIFRRGDIRIFTNEEQFIWFFSPQVDGKINGGASVTATPVSIVYPVDNESSIGVTFPVIVRDQTTQSLDLIFLKDVDNTNLEGAAVLNSRFFNVAVGDGSKFSIDNVIEIGSASTFIQAIVIGIAVDTIEIDTPLNSAYADGSTVFIKDGNLRVDGSVTPQIFEISPQPDQIGEITRIILRMEATTVMDSGTFGPLGKLDNGVVLRKKLPNGDFNNLLNFKTNGDFIAHCFDNEFLPNNGNGIRLFTARLSYAGQSKHGVAQQLDGALNEELQVIIQDDLTGANFTSFTLVTQGHEE